MFKVLFLIYSSILILSLFSGLVSATETTNNISAILKKDVMLGDDLKFDMFLRSSITFEAPEKTKPGENITGSFVFNPATVMIYLEIPSINQTYATETEIPLEDSKPITVFDGVTLVIDLMPSANLAVLGPASINQINIAWENFLDKQSFGASVFVNASSRDEITLNSVFYLNVKISAYIQLQNYTTEIIGYPIPQIEMSPKISNTFDIESTPTIFDSLGNPTNILALAAVTTLIIVSLFSIKKILKRKKIEKELLSPITKQTEVIRKENQSEKTENVVYCIYCGEQLPIEAGYCRKCGKKIK